MLNLTGKYHSSIVGTRKSVRHYFGAFRSNEHESGLQFTQLVANADDINIMIRSKDETEETYAVLKQSAEVVGLSINTN